MIFTVFQTRTNFDLVWIAEERSTPVCTCVCPFEKGRVHVSLDYPDNTSNVLVYNPNGENGHSLTERLSFKLFCNSEIVGTIIGRNKKVKGLFQSYPYRMMTVDSLNIYYLYEIGFGSKGLFLCIYHNDALICTIEKNLTVQNYQDTYTGYLVSRSEIKCVLPLLIHYDLTAHGDIMDISLYSLTRKKVNTVQKELIGKYDQQFIPRIIAQEHQQSDKPS